MRKGIIRPRQIHNPSDNHQEEKYSNNKALRGLKSKKGFAIAIFVLSLVGLMWLFSIGSKDKDTVSVSVDFVRNDMDKSVRGNLVVEDDEDGDDDEQIADEDNEDEDNENEDDEEDIDNNDEDQDNEEGDDEDGRNDINQDEDQDEQEEPNESNRLEFIDADEGNEEEEEHLQPLGGKKALTIDAYFLSLRKKVVNISPSGSYKFVLVHAKDYLGNGTYIVQGCNHKVKTCKHPDAARIVRHSLKTHGIESRVLGGGRITRHHLRKSAKAGLISIFGYSRTYGRCNDCNRKACTFIAAAYPDYVVRWSNQGYHESDESNIHDFIKCSS